MTQFICLKIVNHYFRDGAPSFADPGGDEKDSGDCSSTCNPVVLIMCRGRQYKLPMGCLARHPSSRLAQDAMAAREAAPEKMQIELEYYRNASILEVILDYFEDGHLHFPNGICWRTYESEFKFWRLDTEQISACCKERYSAAGAIQQTLLRLQRDWERHMGRRLQDLSSQKPLGKISHRIWYFFEDADSSIYARVRILQNKKQFAVESARMALLC